MTKTITTEIVSTRVNERCVRLDHPSGLPIFVWTKPGYQSSYATFATRYGSIDTAFTTKEGMTVVPAGIAHYLEHKLFENEDCDAFVRYAETGASANAYTSFDRTAYLFTCTEQVEKSLEILLDFVQSPYFTKETVEKEQGIIGQEIRMCEDSPSRRVLFNLLRALYHEHPIKIDIAGTVESIAQITPELLYGCYHTFYNLKNMVLTVVGDITPEQVLAVADRLLKPAADELLPKRAVINEPAEVVTPRVEENMPVAAPLFYVGYKDITLAREGGRCRTPKELVAADVLLDILAGKASPLYARLMEQGLINSSFDVEYFEGPGYATWLFGGESRDPDAASKALFEEIERVRGTGLDPALFESARNALYGRLISRLNDVENCGNMLVNDYFYQRKPFELIDEAAGLDIQSVYAFLQEGLKRESAALSVVTPSCTNSGTNTI